MLTRLLLIVSFTVFSLYPIEAQWDYSLGARELQIIEHDLENLCLLDFNAKLEGREEMEAIMKEIFEIEEVNCTRLREYLESRIQLITRGIDADNLLFFHRTYGRIIRDIDLAERAEEFFNNQKDVYAVHLSQTLYKLLNSTHEVFFEYFAGSGKKKILQINKPTVPGIIQLSRSFFMDATFPNLQNFGAVPNSILRISTLIHESRHNGEFTHVSCNINLYRDLNMNCDDNFSGPYGSRGLFLLYAASICNDCTKEEEERLLLLGRIGVRRVNNSSPIKMRVLQLAKRMNGG